MSFDFDQVLRDAERAADRGEKAKQRVELGAKIGGALGSIVPGVGNAIGAAAGGVAVAIAEAYDIMSDIFGDGDGIDFVEVRDDFGSRMVPQGWRPDLKLAWERQPAGEPFFRARRAQEDGAARSEVLAYLSRALRAYPDLSAELAERAAEQADLEAQAKTLQGFDPAIERAQNRTFAAMEQVPANRPIVLGLYARQFLTRNGVSRPEADAIARQAFGLALPGADQWQRRAAAARQRYLAGGGVSTDDVRRRDFADGDPNDGRPRVRTRDGRVIYADPAPSPFAKGDPHDGRPRVRTRDGQVIYADPPKRAVVKPEASRPRPVAVTMIPTPEVRAMNQGIVRLPSMQTQTTGGGQLVWRGAWKGFVLSIWRMPGDVWCGRLDVTTAQGPIAFEARVAGQTLRGLASRAGVGLGAMVAGDVDVVGGVPIQVVVGALGRSLQGQASTYQAQPYRGPYGLSLVRTTPATRQLRAPSRPHVRTREPGGTFQPRNFSVTDPNNNRPRLRTRGGRTTYL